jgi:hypothetical protein
MFQFGTVEDNAKVYLDLALSQQGLTMPNVPATEYHTLTGDELKGGLVYLRMAIRAATKADATDDVIELLFTYYDKTFEKVLEEDESFRSVVCTGIHQPLNGLSEKYKTMAGCNV